jgi:hypothetical protein
MAGYTREFLIDAFMSRYTGCKALSVEQLVKQEQMACDLYDKVGRDKFRVYASLDADAIKTYKDTL